MKFDALAQRIIQENQSQGSSPAERAATAQAHAKALARNPAQNKWVEFAPASTVAAAIDADEQAKRSGERGYQNVEDVQVDGLAVGLRKTGKYYKVTNQFQWVDFKKAMDLSAGTDYVEHDDQLAPSAFPATEAPHDYTKEMRAGVGYR